MNKTKRISSMILTIVLLQVSNLTQAQVEDFTLTNTVDNSKISLSSYSDKKAVVLIFTGNYCPFSKLYENRIKHMAANNDQVQFLLVNSNNAAASKHDTVEEMVKRAKENNYSFPYLADKEQKVSTLLGATKTPEAFVLSATTNGFKVIYKGAIDDNPQVEQDVNKHYLSDAIAAAVVGKKPIVATTRPTGCIIKR